jgi:putative ABC transport system permease protein
VAVINETMARVFWPNQDPIGQRMAWGMPNNHGRWMRIVGIVGDVKQGTLSTPTVAQSYQPWTQQIPDATPASQVFISLRSLVLSVRTSGDPLSLASTLQQEVRRLDPSLPVAQVRTMDAIVSESAAPQRFNTALLSLFAATALLLAALGIAGVLATTVSRRTREIGVRMALGANRRDVVGLVIRQGMSLVVIGLAIGIPAGLLATRLMSSLLFDTSARDPLTFTIASLVLLTVAFAACAVPAWRAARVDPMTALRVE